MGSVHRIDLGNFFEDLVSNVFDLQGDDSEDPEFHGGSSFPCLEVLTGHCHAMKFLPSIVAWWRHMPTLTFYAVLHLICSITYFLTSWS